MTTITGRRFNYVSKEAAEIAIRNALLNDAQVISPFMGRGREAVMNCIEACLRAKDTAGPEYKPAIYIGPHPSPQLSHLFCFADNGDGMTAQDVDAHLASYGYSGNTVYQQQGNQVAPFDVNKGIGVKASLLHKNRAGLEYVSLRKGSSEPTMFKLAWDPEGFPVLKYLSDDDGWAGEPTTSACLSLEDWDGNLFPDLKAAGHGTILTLWGNDPRGEESTLETTDFTVNHQRTGGVWNYLAFLNRRFWDFQGVVVEVGGGFHGGAGGTLKTQIARGAGHYLATADRSGELELHLPDGQPVTLRWFVMPARSKTETYTSDQMRCDRTFAAHGHFALKYQHECYWKYLAPVTELKATFRNFGIYTGEHLVCLYLDLDTLTPEAKQHLTVDRYRERVYFRNVEVTDAMFSLQFQKHLSDRNPALQGLLDYLDSLELDRRSDEQHELDLLRQLQRAGLLDNRDKLLDASKSGEEPSAAGSGKLTPPEAKPGEPSPAPTNPPRLRRVLQPRGNQETGSAGWLNGLPRREWKDGDNGDTACEYTSGVFYFWRGWFGFEVLVGHLIRRSTQTSPTINRTYLRELVTKEVEHLAEVIAVTHVYRTDEVARRGQRPIETVTHLKTPEALTTLMVVNPEMEARLLRTITRHLNG